MEVDGTEAIELPIPPTRPSVLPTPGRHPWAELLKRTFRHDVTVCPNCAGPLRLVEVAHDPASIARVMTRAGLGPMPPSPPALPVPVRGQIELPI